MKSVKMVILSVITDKNGFFIEIISYTFAELEQMKKYWCCIFICLLYWYLSVFQLLYCEEKAYN